MNCHTLELSAGTLARIYVRHTHSEHATAIVAGPHILKTSDNIALEKQFMCVSTF